MIRLGEALACCALVAGCTSYGVYPDSWAEQAEVKSGDCPAIDGEYLGVGETFNESKGEFQEGRPIDLAGTLSEGIDYSIPGAEHLEKIGLELVDKTLRVTANLTDGSSMRFERPVLECRDSMLVVETDWMHSAEEEGGAEALGTTMGMFHFFERKSWMLGRSKDGSLLMRKSAGGSLMLYWIPVLPGWETTWVRFPEFAPTLPDAAVPRPTE